MIIMFNNDITKMKEIISFTFGKCIDHFLGINQF